MRYREIFGEERSAVRGAWGIANRGSLRVSRWQHEPGARGSDVAQPIRKRLRPEATPDPAVARQLPDKNNLRVAATAWTTTSTEGSRIRDVPPADSEPVYRP